MKKMIWILLTVGGCLVGLARASEGEAPVPVAVLESESFEAVGRLKENGLSWYIDRAETNVPVLGATVELESAGRNVKAVFRPEIGDYWIADEAWLMPLRATGHHALSLTLMAGEDSDLLAGELHVEAPEAATLLAVDARLRWGGLALLGGGLLWFAWRRKRGGTA